MSTVYVATGYTVVPFLIAQRYIKTQMQCMSFLCLYIYKGSRYVGDTKIVCVILFTEKNCPHIIHKSFYKAAFCCNLLSIESLIFTFFITVRCFMLSFMSPVEKSQHPCSVLTTYLKDNTALFMHTYTVNKILDIKLSLWQM